MAEATGEKITATLLLQAYATGVFPMADGAGSDTIFWVDPRRRGILPLNPGLEFPIKVVQLRPNHQQKK
jgi:Leu/Phe-tRNA-protein transferase